MPVMRHIYNYLQILPIFTIFFYVGKEKILNNFLFLLYLYIIWIFMNAYYFYKQENKVGLL